MNETQITPDQERRRWDSISMVSHELRTPLTAIQASIKLIAAGILGKTTPDQQEALSLAIKNLDRMGRLINDLLDITKIESGHMELHRQRVDFNGLIRDLARTFEPLARERGLNIRTEVPPMRVDLLVDRDKMVQVFSNLIHNALKFTAQGGITVTLRTAGDYIECQVSDTGAGIAPKDIPFVFSKFMQFSQRAPAAERGTGLGLTLTKHLVELHGGKITLESQLGEGTTFTLVLPKIAPESWFKEEALKLFTEAQASERSCSFIHVHITSWESVLKRIGDESALTFLNHLETLIRASLRNEQDVIIQMRGALWLALPQVDRAKATAIAQRIEEGLKEDPLWRQMPLSLNLELQVINYPDDIHVVEEILTLVQ
jgi:two-component sensor histidine kinase